MKKISRKEPISEKETVLPVGFIPPSGSKKIARVGHSYGKKARHPTASSSPTVKEAEMRPPSATPEEVDKVQLPVDSGKTTESLRTKGPRSKTDMDRFYHAPIPRSNVSVNVKVSFSMVVGNIFSSK